MISRTFGRRWGRRAGTDQTTTTMITNPERLGDPDTYTWSPLNRPDGPRRPAVAICGSAYNVKHAPLEDDHWDVWALNNCAPIDSAGRLRADRWWEIHAQEVRTEDRWETMHRIAEHIPVMTMDTRLGFGRLFDVDALPQMA